MRLRSLPACAFLALGCAEVLEPERAAAPEAACQPLVAQQVPAEASVVLVVNDTMRRDRVGAYGGTVPTPAFDALAREGWLFTRAHSTAPWTKPAVASLFTGLYPSQHGALDDPRMVGRGLRGGGRTDVLGAGLTTLAEALRAAGFRTAAFVSNPWLGREFGFAQGFEVYDDSGARWDEPGEQLVRRGLAWLAGLPEGARFLLYLHTIDSHLPYGALDPLEILAERERLEADSRPLPGEGLGILAELRTPRGDPLLAATGAPPTLALIELAYDRGISRFDAALGLLLDGLRARPEWSRTAVIVTSDHGEALFERGYGNHGRALFDEEIAVPQAARLPGVGPGGTVDCGTTLADWLPTLCDYLEVSCPEGLAGSSLLARPGSAAPGAPRYLVAEGVPMARAHRSLRNRRYKLIYEPEGPLGQDFERDAELARRKPYALFDLQADPAERRDLLAGGEPSAPTREVFRILREALDDSRPEAGDASSETAPIPADLRERLDALGYGE